MIFVKGAGEKPILPKMARQIPLNVLPTRIIIVESTESAGQGIWASGHQYMVGVIGHE